MNTPTQRYARAKELLTTVLTAEEVDDIVVLIAIVTPEVLVRVLMESAKITEAEPIIVTKTSETVN